MMRSKLRGLLFPLLFASVPALLSAQTVDTAITGTITDSTGAVIPGASVKVTAGSTGIAKQAVTTTSGDYIVNYLIPDTYDVVVSANGFGSFERKGIVLQVNQTAELNVTLKVAGSQQVVEVEAAQPLLQTQNASLGVVVGPTSTVNLPLNGRKFDDLAILTPGVTTSDPDNHSSSTAGSSINAYGSQVTWAQTNVDGVTMVNNRHAYVNVFPSVDAVQEFNVLTGNYPAEYDGGAGTVTNIQLKSGTNEWHGDAFEFLRNPVLDARNYFRPAPLGKQTLKQNQFGATLGGPIIKDRTFFFVSYEGLRSIEDTPSVTNVLTSEEEGGNFSAISKQLVSPCTGLAYPGNIIPSDNTPANTNPNCHDGLDTVSQSIAETYMPAPNYTSKSGNYSGVSRGFETANQFIARVDHRINAANQLMVHLIYANRNFPDAAIDPDFTYSGTYPAYNAALQYVHTFSPRLLNELRLGYDYEHVKQLSTLAYTNFTAASVGINQFTLNGAPIPPPDEGFPVLSTSGFIAMGSGTAASNLDDSGTYQMVDNMTWTHGAHTFVFGADIRHNQDDATTDNDPYGEMSFTGAETGNAAADYMIGSPASVITPEGVPLTEARQWRDFLYFEDDWKFTPKLTFNLGLNYSLWVPPHDNLDTSGMLNYATSPPTVVPLPNPIWHITHKNFGPRLGFAYNLPHQMVVRGGYGITYYGGQFDNINILQLNPPHDPSFSLSNGTNPANPPLATIQDPVPSAITPATPNVVSDPQNRDHPDVYLQTYNLTLSKQFWANVLDIGYVGVKGTHEETSDSSSNSGPPQAAGLSVQADRPFPTFGHIRYVYYEGASMYNGLNIHFEHRVTHQLNLTAAFSWAHFEDNYGVDVNSGGNETQTLALVWANGLNDVRHNATVAAVWQTPKLIGGNAAVRDIVNDWGVNLIFQFISGTPLLVTQAVDGENNGNGTEYPNVVAGQPFTLSHRTTGEWFNTAAFTEAIAQYGNSPRNPVTGPDVRPLTLAIARVFPMPFKEQQRLEFRVEAFNVLNQPQFSAPNGSQGSSTFGTISSTVIDNRELQGVLKYYF
jgi:hypothetical protein